MKYFLRMVNVTVERRDVFQLMLKDALLSRTIMILLQYISLGRRFISEVIIEPANVWLAYEIMDLNPYFTKGKVPILL